MPVPDSARTAALEVSDKLGVKYREGLVKNRYIGRTFIMPGQRIRKKSIRYKLNAMPLEIAGKNVLLVDDSIVRGNTSRQIVDMVRQAGAKKVYFSSYSPPVVSPNLYGIDMATKEELIASHSNVDEICKFIGADALFYGDLDDIVDSCVKGNPKIKDFEMSCFDGCYKTGDVDEDVLRKNAEGRLGDKGAEAFVGEEPGEGQLNLL